MTWVLARGEEGAQEYWTGRVRRGEPLTSPYTSDAFKFHDAQAANECATTHPALWSRDDWRPIRLQPRCERMS